MDIVCCFKFLTFTCHQQFTQRPYMLTTSVNASQYPLHNELNASLRFHKNKKFLMPHNSHKGMQQYRHLITLIPFTRALNHQTQLTSYSSTQNLFNYKLS